MSVNPPPMPMMSYQAAAGPAGHDAANVVLVVLMWIAWVGVIVVADFLGFMMFAFADSPSSANAAKLMIGPVFIWFGITFVAGVVLLIFKGWWQIPLAFTLAISPPFLVFLGYNLLAGASNVTYTPNMPPPTPAVRINQQTFTPTPTSMPTQPDFQAMIRKATTRPTEEKDQ